jgi:glycosyltransferase involved in cell wall biosynthesis
MAGRLQNLEKAIKTAEPTIFQFIVVHDFRDEDTSFELKELINRLNNGHIELFEGKFGSAGSARNEGMLRATGKYLAFWDSDDIGYPEQIEKVIKEIDWRSFSAVASSFEVVKGHSSKNHSFTEDKKRNLNLLASYPGLWRWIFLREDLQVDFTPLSMGEDQLFLVQNLQKLKFTFSEKITYQYFLGVENQSTETFDKRKSKDLSEVFSRVRKIEKTSEGMNKSLLSRMVISQAFTLLKYSSPREKLVYLHEILFNANKAFSLLRIRINDGF